jgi:hypothetical protein
MIVQGSVTFDNKSLVNLDRDLIHIFKIEEFTPRPPSFQHWISANE